MNQDLVAVSSPPPSSANLDKTSQEITLFWEGLTFCVPAKEPVPSHGLETENNDNTVLNGNNNNGIRFPESSRSAAIYERPDNEDRRVEPHWDGPSQRNRGSHRPHCERENSAAKHIQ